MANKIDIADVAAQGRGLRLVAEPMLVGEPGTAAIFPRSGWIADHVRLVSEHTDAPTLYHLFSAISALGVAIGRSHGVKFGMSWIFPNFYILLLGDSGLRKSTAYRAAAAHIPPELKAPRPGSAEGLYKRLGEQPRSIFTIDEWGGFVKRLGREYMGGVLEDLTEIYECPLQFAPAQTKTSNIVVERPFVSILAASTPDWLEDRVKEGEFKGGFYSRFCFVPATERHGYMPWPAPVDPVRFKALTDRLEPILTSGRADGKPTVIDIDREAKERFTAWMRDHELGEQPDPILGGFYKRAPVLAVKFALVHQFGLVGVPTSIGTEAVELGIATVEWLKRAAGEVTGSLAFTPAAQRQRRMEQVIAARKHHGITERDLAKALRWDTRDVQATLGALDQQGLVQRRPGRQHNSAVIVASSAVKP